MFVTVMIPAWAFTLGQEIFSSGEMVVPYSRIASSAIGMVVPLGIGCGIQHYCPTLCKLLVRILKPFSIALILSIIIFATITNWYLFRLFTWQVRLVKENSMLGRNALFEIMFSNVFLGDQRIMLCVMILVVIEQFTFTS